MNTPRISSPPDLQMDSAALSALARQRSPVSLRRAGSLTELLVVGVSDCLANQPDMPTAVVCGSKLGIVEAGMRLVKSIEIVREEPFPFDFLASQPILASVTLKKSFPCIENVIYQPWGGDTELNWERARSLAKAWLRAGRYMRVLCGQVEPDEPDGRAHFGHWEVFWF